MWPTTARSGAASPTLAIEEPIPSVVSVGERRLLAPDGGRRSLVARGGRGAQQLVEKFGGFGHRVGQYAESNDVRCLQKFRIALTAMARIAHSIALVTGASSGIGEATARRLAREPGAELVLVARREERLRALADSLPCQATYVAADLTDEDAPRAVRDHVAEHHDGRLTLLVNNAGSSWRASFGEGGYANVRRHMELNFDAVLRLTEALLPTLRASAPSAIVNVASTAGRVARARTGSYSASKFALIGWNDALYAEERAQRRPRRARAAGLHRHRGLPGDRAARAGDHPLGRLQAGEGGGGDRRDGARGEGRALRAAALRAGGGRPHRRAEPDPAGPLRRRRRDPDDEHRGRIPGMTQIRSR